MRWAARLNISKKSMLQHGEELALENCDIPIKFRRHPKARRLTLRVSSTDRSAIVTVPPYCSDKETISFLENHRNWLFEQFEKLPEAAPFKHESIIPLRGEPHKLIFAGQSRGKGVIWIENQISEDENTEATETQIPEKQTSEIKANSLPEIHINGTEQFAPRRLTRWLIDQARKDLQERSKWHSDNFGLNYQKIMIKDQRSRWGSCSSRGILSYSWRLILAPSDVLDYVAAHEVAHLAEMNHGPNFWALVEQTLPTYQAPKTWLRDHGSELHRYGANS